MYCRDLNTRHLNTTNFLKRDFYVWLLIIESIQLLRAYNYWCSIQVINTVFRIWMVQSCLIGKWFGFRSPFKIWIPEQSKTKQNGGHLWITYTGSVFEWLGPPLYWMFPLWLSFKTNSHCYCSMKYWRNWWHLYDNVLNTILH